MIKKLYRINNPKEHTLQVRLFWVRDIIEGSKDEFNSTLLFERDKEFLQHSDLKQNYYPIIHQDN